MPAKGIMEFWKKIFLTFNFFLDTVYYLAKILILDSYRTHACIIFKPIVIAISCIIIASGSYNFDIYCHKFGVEN